MRTAAKQAGLLVRVAGGQGGVRCGGGERRQRGVCGGRTQEKAQGGGGGPMATPEGVCPVRLSAGTARPVAGSPTKERRETNPCVDCCVLQVVAQTV